MLYYVYKNDDRIEEHAPKFNSTYTFPPEGSQVPELTKDGEVNQDFWLRGHSMSTKVLMSSNVGTIVTQNHNLVMMLLFLRLRSMLLTKEVVVDAS